MVKIILTALDDLLEDAWKKYCGDLEDVTVLSGSIFGISCDAVVSPANSFGFMDGGIDLLYSRHFGWHVQERLQNLIREQHHGELLVGTAEIVETDDENILFLIAAPTMRVPMILRHSVTPYLAARAALLLVTEGEFKAGHIRQGRIRDSVKSVAFPGLGTGVGRIPVAVCARQVRAAIEDVLDLTEFPLSWTEAQERHQKLYSSRARDLQLDDPDFSGDDILKRMRGRFDGHFRKSKRRD
jgi:O-acetyl-ADP-ribose deacetylase (regulator of RNase III)